LEIFTNRINEKFDRKIIWNKIQSLKGLGRSQNINLIQATTKQLVINQEQIYLINYANTLLYKNSSDSNYISKFIFHKENFENKIVIKTIYNQHIDQIKINGLINMQLIMINHSVC